MGSLDSFMGKFGGQAEIAPEDLPEGARPDSSLGSFFGKFGGPPMTSYWFYEGSVEIRFDPVDHIYYLVEPLGNLTPLLNVSTVSHIVDRSMALIPWCAKVTIEKMLRTIPVQTITTGPEDLSPLIIVPAMTLAEFTRLALEAKSAHKDKLEDAGEVGHMAHFWIEQYIKTRIGKNEIEKDKLLGTRCTDDRATNATIAMLAWEKAHNVRWLSTEQKCYSKEHNCSGTMDGMALVDSCTDLTCCRVEFKDHLSLIDWKTSNYLYVEFLFQSAAYEGFHMEEFPNVHILDRWIIRLGKDDAEFDPWYLPAETFAADYAGFLACLELKRLVIAAEERLKVQKQGVRAAKKAAKDSAREIAKATEKAEKAIRKAEAKILKAEEKKLIAAEAKANREAARAEGKRLKEEVKNAQVNAEVDLELTKLLEETKDYVMSAAEKEEQRRSFAYGNMALHNPSITRADIDRAADELDKESTFNIPMD